MIRRACALLLVSLALPAVLTGCAAQESGPSLLNPSGGSLLNPGGSVLQGGTPLPPGQLAPGQLAPGQPGQPALSQVAPAGRTIALLAPLTGPNAERGASLVNAAQLALAAPGSPTLDVRDTGGTPQGAAGAAQAAIAAGAGLIIGPLSAAETGAVAAEATQAGIPVLAFTNDPAQARPGVWTLGITPVQQVRRLVAAASAQGKTRFAAVLPQSDFGNAMGAALTDALGAAGGGTPDIHFHGGGNAEIAETMRQVSDYADRRGPLDAKIKEARERHDADGRKLAADLSRQGVPPAPFDALLLADTGGKLAWLSSFLSYYDIDAPDVRVMGPAIWAQPASRAGAALDGAWYAAPDPAARAGFDQAYAAKYGTPAPGLADLAFDAASIGRVLAGAGGYSMAGLARADGYAGVDGLLALQPDGTVRRALAIFEIHGGGATLSEPAPTSLSGPGF